MSSNIDRPFLLNQADQVALRRELCEKLGFCLLSEECSARLSKTPLTADEFTDLVLSDEEGDASHYPPRVRKSVRNLVAQYYDVATNHGLWWLKFPDGSPET